MGFKPNRAIAGRLFGLMAASFLGINTTLARLAYDGGSNPLTVVATRFLACAIALAFAIKLLRRSYRIPRRTRLRTLGVAVVWFLAPTGYLSSVFFIPVSLAVLIFYTFPLMVAAASPPMEGYRLATARIGTFLLAFTGLAIALSPSFHGLDWRGIALAFLAATGAATTLILSKRLIAEQGVFTFTLYMSTASVILTTAMLPMLGGIALPQDSTGWIGLGGATFGFVVGILALFTAIEHVGPASTALVMNLEPLISIGAAALLLGERLTMLQCAGALMVVSALVLSRQGGAR